MVAPILISLNSASIERVLAAISPRAIVNAAAYTSVDKAESEPEAAFKVNRDGAALLAKEAARLRVPFIHVSTDYVFDGTKTSPYLEHDRPLPLGVYGQSKLEGEAAVLDAYPEALVVRASWVFSPYGHNFVKTMLRLAETRDCLRVVDDQYGAPTYAADIAEALLEMLRQIEVAGRPDRGGIYHLASAGVTTWYGFASAIFAARRKQGGRTPRLEPIKTADYPTPARRPANSRLDCSKIERVFGICLRPWENAVMAFLDEPAALNADV